MDIKGSVVGRGREYGLGAPARKNLRCYKVGRASTVFAYFTRP